MQRLILTVFGVGLSLCVIPQSRAQNSSTAHQHPSGSPMIDGALHPELIPDNIAFRLYFVAVSTGQSPTETERKHQQVQLKKIGLRDDDQAVLAGALADFRAKYDDLVSRYNETARAAEARSESGDIGSLLRALDALVQSTRDTLKVRLTREGAGRLESFVQSEKRNMKVSPEDQ